MSLTSAYLPSGERIMFMGRLPTLSRVPGGGVITLPVTRRPDWKLWAMPLIAVSNVAVKRHNSPNFGPEKRTLVCIVDSPSAGGEGAAAGRRVELRSKFQGASVGQSCTTVTVPIVVRSFCGSANEE